MILMKDTKLAVTQLLVSKGTTIFLRQREESLA